MLLNIFIRLTLSQASTTLTQPYYVIFVRTLCVRVRVCAYVNTSLCMRSLGQVYRARLKKTGEEVAVKVQRPNMLVAVTLDLYIIRNLLQFGQDNVPSIAEQCRSFMMVVDNWAGRFVDELDYVKEVENADRFRQQMQDEATTLGDAIVVPRSFNEFCSGQVLVTEWVQGSKLSSIDQYANRNVEVGRETKRKLLKVLLNSYLVQLLETGFLHADPHP